MALICTSEKEVKTALEQNYYEIVCTSNNNLHKITLYKNKVTDAWACTDCNLEWTNKSCDTTMYTGNKKTAIATYKSWLDKQIETLNVMFNN